MSLPALPVPEFTYVSVESGRSYIQAANKYCLMYYPEIVSIFIGGKMPIEMLEYPQSSAHAGILARRAGTYKDSSGQTALVNQTCVEYRKEIIAKTQADNDNCTEKMAEELLFPPQTLKAREAQRLAINTKLLAFIQCLNLLWPTEEIQLSLQNDPNIADAVAANDLIAWFTAFQSFCLTSSGNLDADALWGGDDNKYGKSGTPSSASRVDDSAQTGNRSGGSSVSNNYNSAFNSETDHATVSVSTSNSSSNSRYNKSRNLQVLGSPVRGSAYDGEDGDISGGGGKSYRQIGGSRPGLLSVSEESCASIWNSCGNKNSNDSNSTGNNSSNYNNTDADQDGDIFFGDIFAVKEVDSIVTTRVNDATGNSYDVKNGDVTTSVRIVDNKSVVYTSSNGNIGLDVKPEPNKILDLVADLKNLHSVVEEPLKRRMGDTLSQTLFADAAMRLPTIDCGLKPFDVELKAPARAKYFDPKDGSVNSSVFNDPIHSDKSLSNFSDLADARISRLQSFGNIVDNVQFMHESSKAPLSELLSENERAVSFLRASRIVDAPFSTESTEIIGNICVAMIENTETKKFSLSFCSTIGSQSISLEEKYKLIAMKGRQKQYYKCFTCQDLFICTVCCRDKADLNSYEDDFDIKYKYHHDFTSQYCTIPLEDCIIDANVHSRSLESVEAAIKGRNSAKLESTVSSSCKPLFDYFECCTGTSSIKAATKLDQSDNKMPDCDCFNGDEAPSLTGFCCEDKSHAHTKDVAFESKLSESMKLGANNANVLQQASISERKNGWNVLKESNVETTVSIHYRSIHDFSIRTCKITLANSGHASSTASRDDLTNAKKFVQLIGLHRVFFKRDPFSVEKQEHDSNSTDGGSSFAMSLSERKKNSSAFSCFNTDDKNSERGRSFIKSLLESNKKSNAFSCFNMDDKNPRIYKVCCFTLPFTDIIFPDEPHLFPYWIVCLTLGLMAPVNICISRSLSKCGHEDFVYIGNCTLNGVFCCIFPICGMRHWL